MTFDEQKMSTLRVNGAVLKGISKDHLQVSDAPISAQALLCLDLFQTLEKNILWIATDVREMERLNESVQTLQGLLEAGGTVSPASSRPCLFQPMEKDPAVFGEHLKLVQMLKENERFIIITCPQAMEQEVPIAEESEQAVQTLTVGNEYKLHDLTEWMSDAGYEFGIEVYAQGEAALRGGILDCWPPGSPRPVRIEFFGDEIDSIRFFDDQSQCSIEKTDSVQLPQMDFGFAGEETSPLTALLPKNTLIVNPQETVTSQSSRQASTFTTPAFLPFPTTRIPKRRSRHAAALSISAAPTLPMIGRFISSLKPTER
jgi:transcription-repair coupling factor (superfamily II helicase)